MKETNDPMPTPSNFCLCSSRSCETCTCDDEHEAALDAWQDKQDDQLREQIQTYKDEACEEGQEE
tara:strand:- start:1295 stop:1489 length:195 start_codon:yes stop_codon:yes gene_type:complete